MSIGSEIWQDAGMFLQMINPNIFSNYSDEEDSEVEEENKNVFFPVITDQEKKLHKEFIETLGENSIWKKIK